MGEVGSSHGERSQGVKAVDAERMGGLAGGGGGGGEAKGERKGKESNQEAGAIRQTEKLQRDGRR